jgi:lipopolysaccharide/colanic/teichoic acid biosynthesis glycosyltransferase
MKRLFDVGCCVLGLIVLAPILLLIALLIRTDSKGPILYVQERIGLNGRPFYIFKFRTMVMDADKKGLLTIGGKDPRVTRIGYSLRRYKLDELPQLFNVLKGDMSLVGPRPEVKKYVDLYSSSQREVLTVKPGITDYASIVFVDENDILAKSADPEQAYIQEIMPAKLALNRKYIDEKGLLTDLRIIVKTLLRIIR